MEGWIIALSLVGAFFAFVLVLVVRALMFKPKTTSAQVPLEVDVDLDKAASDLAEMIKVRTVSHTDKSLDDEAEFLRFKELLPKLFPNI